MIVPSRRALRGTMVVLAVSVLVLAAPAAAAAGGTEAAGSELPIADPVTLVLRPLCTSDGLHRFAVDNVQGPATQFTVGVAGGEGETLPIGAGETRHFWVDAEQRGAVEITWADGSASATGVDEACGRDIVPPDVSLPAPSVTGPPTPTPSGSTSPSPQPRPEAPAPPAIIKKPDSDPAAPAESPKRSGPPHAATSSQTTEAPGDGGPRDTRAEPRPRIVDGLIACPDGWIPVDSDADGRFEPSDKCEVLVETAAKASAPGAAFPAVALIVTIGLLIASIGVGAVGRRA